MVTTWVYPCASSSCALRRDAASRSASIESEGVTLNTTSQSWFARQGSPDVLTIVRTHERGRLFPCERPLARPLCYSLLVPSRRDRPSPAPGRSRAATAATAASRSRRHIANASSGSAVAGALEVTVGVCRGAVKRGWWLPADPSAEVGAFHLTQVAHKAEEGQIGKAGCSSGRVVRG